MCFLGHATPHIFFEQNRKRIQWWPYCFNFTDIVTNAKPSNLTAATIAQSVAVASWKWTITAPGSTTVSHLTITSSSCCSLATLCYTPSSWPYATSNTLSSSGQMASKTLEQRRAKENSTSFSYSSSQSCFVSASPVCFGTILHSFLRPTFSSNFDSFAFIGTTFIWCSIIAQL